MSYSIIRDLEQVGELDKALNYLELETETPNLLLLKADILRFLGEIDASLLISSGVLNNINDSSGSELALIGNVIHAETLLIKSEIKNAETHLRKSSEIIKKTKFVDFHKEYWEGRFNLLQGNFNLKNSKFDQAIKYFQKGKSIFDKLNNKRDFANSVYLTGLAYESQGNLDKALEEFKASIKLREKIGNKYDLASSYNRLGVIYAKKSKFQEAESNLAKSLVFGEEVEFDFELAKIFVNLGIIHKMKGDLTTAQNWYKKALKISQKLDDKENIAKAYGNLGNIQMNNGELDLAIETFTNVLPLLEQSGSLQDRAMTLNNLGIIYKRKGEFNQALKYYQMSLSIEKEIGNERDIAPTLHNIGVVSVHQGNLKIALENFQSALAIWEKLDNFVDKATALQYIGLIYLEKDMVQESLNYLKQALELRKKLNNDITTSETLYYMILADTELDNSKNAEKHYKDLVKINKRTNNKVIKTRTRLAQAILLQKDTRINKIVEAQELFEEILSEDLVDNELTIFAMLKLCEFLLLELKVSGEKEVLVEIKTLLEKLYEMAQEQESHTLLIEILIIQSQLALADYNIKETKEFLQHANEIAEEKELNHYKLKISYLLDRVEKDVIKYANIASTIPINERIDQLAIESYLKEVADHKDLNSFNPEMFKTGLKKNLQMHLNFANLLLMDKTLPEEMKKYIHFIDLSAKEIQFSISTLLMIEKLEAGTYYQNLEDFNLDQIIQLRINNYEEKLNEKSLVVDFQKTNGITAVRSDSYLLSRIIDHLLDNAIKFAYEKSTIKIVLETDEISRTITIENECEPIPEHEQSNLFDKYTQYLVHESTRKHGVGLGLAFCDHAIKSIKGEINLVSPVQNKNTGVSVTVKIPKEI